MTEKDFEIVSGSAHDETFTAANATLDDKVQLIVYNSSVPVVVKRSAAYGGSTAEIEITEDTGYQVKFTAEETTLIGDGATHSLAKIEEAVTELFAGEITVEGGTYVPAYAPEAVPLSVISQKQASPSENLKTLLPANHAVAFAIFDFSGAASSVSLKDTDGKVYTTDGSTLAAGRLYLLGSGASSETEENLQVFAEGESLTIDAWIFIVPVAEPNK